MYYISCMLNLKIKLKESLNISGLVELPLVYCIYFVYKCNGCVRLEMQIIVNRTFQNFRLLYYALLCSAIVV